MYKVSFYFFYFALYVPYWLMNILVITLEFEIRKQVAQILFSIKLVSNLNVFSSSLLGWSGLVRLTLKLSFLLD